MTQRTLGRGLGSLIPSKSVPDDGGSLRAVAGEQIHEIETNKIQPNSHQPRQQFDREALDDLVNSIKVHGIIQPLIVVETRGAYQLVAGERRLRAAKLLGLKKVPVIIRSVTDQQKFEWAIVENVQRQNLNPLEKARAYQRLIDEFNLTQEEVAKKVGQNRVTVANTLRLLHLPQEIQDGLRAGKITEGHAKVLLSVSNEEERLRMYRDIVKGGMSVRVSEAQVRKVSVKKHNRILRKDANLREKEEQLQDALGTKVEIKKNGPRGAIMVHFYSLEELIEIIRKITR